MLTKITDDLWLDIDTIVKFNGSTGYTQFLIGTYVEVVSFDSPEKDCLERILEERRLRNVLMESQA
jgi:hypothetical protein